MNISIIIPAYNEENYLPGTMATLHKHRFWNELIIVDDGSVDCTKNVDLPDRAKMLVHPKNMGKGKAIQTGIEASVGDIIVLLDADLGNSAQYAYRLVEPVIKEGIHMTIAKFPSAGTNGGFGIVKRMAEVGIRWLTGETVTEPLSGQRCLKREVLHAIKNYHVGYGIEVALTLDIIRAGFTYKEVEVPFHHRQLGRTWRGFCHRGKELTHIARTLWMKRA